jgi:hypothetical protein
VAAAALTVIFGAIGAGARRVDADDDSRRLA